MSLQNDNFRETTRKQSWYNSTFRSTYDLELADQTFGEVIDRYGRGLSLASFANLAGRTMPVRNDTITIFEKGAPTRPVTVSIAVDAAPVTNADVTLNVADGSDAYMRANFSIIIPASYTNKSVNQELHITGSAGAWKGYFKDVTAAVTTALDGVYCAVGASTYGYGTNQPEPMARGTYSRTTNQRIIKSSNAIEGASIYYEKYDEFKTKEGGRGNWSKSIAELDFDIDDQMDSALIAGQTVTNTGIVMTSVDGTSKQVPSAEGLDVIMAELGQELEWDASGFGIAKWRAIRPLLENVGVVNQKLDFFVGSDLMSSIEEEMNDYLASNAGGQTYWDKLGNVGFYVKNINLDGVQTGVMKLHALSNPNKFGLDSYTYKKEGYMFTAGEYKATLQDGGKQELRLPHLTLGYPMGNGENRQRIFTFEPGVHGIEGVPNLATNSYDGVKIHALAHFIPIWNHMYKTIKVNYDAGGAGS